MGNFVRRGLPSIRSGADATDNNKEEHRQRGNNAASFSVDGKDWRLRAKSEENFDIFWKIIVVIMCPMNQNLSYKSTMLPTQLEE